MLSRDRIPVTAATRWREFRVRVLPAVAMAAALLGTGALWRHTLPAVALQGQVEYSGDQITAYLPQPLPFHPRIGDSVEVRTRSYPGTMAPATIIAVGAQMELIPAALCPAHRTGSNRWGIPIVMSRPASLDMVSGDLVDLLLRAE